jgi:hypothetical protein
MHKNHGMVVSSASRTILDRAEADTPPHQIELAVVQATERGLVRPERRRQRAAERGHRVTELIDGAVSLVAA